MTDNQIAAPQTKHEWSHIILEDDVVSKPSKLTITANETERKAVAKRLGIVAIERLETDLTLTRNKGNMVIHIVGNLRATVTQRCIVTLEPVTEVIEEEYEGWFADSNQAVSFAKAKRERMTLQEQMEQPLLEEQEDPEPIIDGKIDLGEFTTQYLSLALNPYPRAEGAEHVNKYVKNKGAEDEDIYDNPFAALKEWKAKEQKKD